jgi:hypothetical protein
VLVRPADHVPEWFAAQVRLGLLADQPGRSLPRYRGGRGHVRGDEDPGQRPQVMATPATRYEGTHISTPPTVLI